MDRRSEPGRIVSIQNALPQRKDPSIFPDRHRIDRVKSARLVRKDISLFRFNVTAKLAALYVLVACELDFADLVFSALANLIDDVAETSSRIPVNFIFNTARENRFEIKFFNRLSRLFNPTLVEDLVRQDCYLAFQSPVANPLIPIETDGSDPKLGPNVEKQIDPVRIYWLQPYFDARKLLAERSNVTVDSDSIIRLAFSKRHVRLSHLFIDIRESCKIDNNLRMVGGSAPSGALPN